MFEIVNLGMLSVSSQGQRRRMIGWCDLIGRWPIVLSVAALILTTCKRVCVCRVCQLACTNCNKKQLLTALDAYYHLFAYYYIYYYYFYCM